VVHLEQASRLAHAATSRIAADVRPRARPEVLVCRHLVASWNASDGRHVAQIDNESQREYVHRRRARI